MERRCGILAGECYLRHETGPHVETPARLRVLYEMIAREGFGNRTLSITPRPATLEEVAMNHTPAYIERLRTFGAGHLNADTVLSADSFETALLAVGGGLNLVDAVMRGEIDRGFALIRPPGHHAEAGMGMGFCLFNNIAVAARHLLKTHGLRRIAIVDWDLHHGNGTQNAFYGEREVLYLSLHQSPCYPGTGHAGERGEGPGEGFTVNLPLPPGVGDDGYLAAFDALFLPLVDRYMPEIILVSAGFDAHRHDPLGGMELSAAGFGEMARRLMVAADRHCGGRIVFFLEGGYSLDGMTASVREILLAAVDGKASESRTLTRGIDITPELSRAKECWKL